MPTPVPFSATLLWLCGILKLIPSLFLLIAGGVTLTGSALLLNDSSNQSSGGNFLQGLAVLGGGILGIALLIFGVILFLSGLFDTIAGSMARKGRSAGRIMGIISAVFGLLSGCGAVTSALFSPNNDSGSAFVGGLFGAMPFLAVNGYLLVSFINNPNAFRN